MAVVVLLPDCGQQFSKTQGRCRAQQLRLPRIRMKCQPILGKTNRGTGCRSAVERNGFAVGGRGVA
jgi:hypothetical protein